MLGSDILIETLIENNVEVIFGYPGGAIMPVYDSISKYTQIRHILVRHEQGAIHAAEGFARASRSVGVCISTSGPGATNLITGLADAMMDSVPLVVITGQVDSRFIGTEAFQEVDVVGVSAVVTKYNYLITDAAYIKETVSEAFRIAQSGRPGPVLIDISKDAQNQKVDSSKKIESVFNLGQNQEKNNKGLISKAMDLINRSERPLILSGHGVILSKSSKYLLEFAKKGNIPVSETLHGLSSYPQEESKYIGFLGMHGNYAPNMATSKADCIIALGMRFDDRITGRLSGYAPEAKVIHVEINKHEIDKNVKADLPINMDVRDFLKEIIPSIEYKDRLDWFDQIQKWEDKERDIVYKKDFNTDSLNCPYIIKTLSDELKGISNIISDVGQHQMTTARYFNFNLENSFFTSGGAGTMGFALPASIGVQIAKKDEPVWVIVGDGGFQMTLQEMAVIKQENLNIKIAIINNSHLGMVRQWQDLFFDKNRSQVFLQNPNFVKLSEGFGIKAKKVTKKADVLQSIKDAMDFEGPFLIEFETSKEDFVFPMIAPGDSTSEMKLE